MLYPALELLEGGGKLLDWLYDSTRNFVSSVSSTLELPDTDCKQSAPGSDSPLRRGAARSHHRFCCYPVFWRGKNDIVRPSQWR